MTSCVSYSCSSQTSLGRLFEQDEIKDEIFLNDKQRIINSLAFRRLEYKTQVFVNHVGDHYRTRLTHSIEVAHVAKTICRKLGINEDLAETVALSHDLGHPPFGHAGEYGLNLAMAEYGGFDHNIQTIKIVTHLEKKFHEFDGLNLSSETLDGILKHNGPIDIEQNPQLAKLLKGLEIDFTSQATLEAQAAAQSDDIAYINHDIDDGLRADMFKIDELIDLPIIGKLLRKIDSKKLNKSLTKNELIRQFSKLMIDDLVVNTLANIKSNYIVTVKDVVNCKKPLLAFSDEFESAKKVIKEFLMLKVYRNYRVNRMTQKAISLINDIFNRYLQAPNCLPEEWYNKIKTNDNHEIAYCISDYIAGMTDRFAIEEYSRLFDPKLF